MELDGQFVSAEVQMFDGIQVGLLAYYMYLHVP